MDSDLFFHVDTTRGYTYRYYHHRALGGKPTLLFIHGFPSSSSDWRKQVSYFQTLQYGVLVPDLLGAGGSSKPLESKAFRLNAMAADIIEIMDKTQLSQVIGVGHDWGSVLLSRLAELYPERFYGFAWIGLSFMQPITQPFDLDMAMRVTKSTLGYEGYAYWEFFMIGYASSIVQSNVDSFIQLLYPKDPSDWRTYIALPGKTEECIRSGMLLGRPDYLSETEYNELREDILTYGLESSLNWYRSQLQNNDLEDNLNIPEKDWIIRAPSLFAAASKDCLCTPEFGRQNMEKFGTRVEYAQFDAGHWLQLERPNELNEVLEKWVVQLSLF